MNIDIASPGMIGALTALLLILIAWRLTPAIGKSRRQKQMDDLLSGQPPDEQDGGNALTPLGRLAKKYLPASTIDGTRKDLYWAHRNGKLTSFDAATYTALRVLIAAGIATYSYTFTGSLFNAVLMGGGSYWLVGVYLQSMAGKSRRQFRQALPMAVSMLDMLRAGGASLDEAVRTMVSEGDDIVSRWMAEVAASARGQKLTEAMVQAAKETSLPPLVRVCTTLDDIEVRGVGLERLATTAQEMVQDYKRELEKDASTLGVTSVFIIIIFDMLPFMALVAGPWALQAFGLFG